MFENNAITNRLREHVSSILVTLIEEVTSKSVERHSFSDAENKLSKAMNGLYTRCVDYIVHSIELKEVLIDVVNDVVDSKFDDEFGGTTNRNLHNFIHDVIGDKLADSLEDKIRDMGLVDDETLSHEIEDAIENNQFMTDMNEKIQELSCKLEELSKPQFLTRKLEEVLTDRAIDILKQNPYSPIAPEYFKMAIEVFQLKNKIDNLISAAHVSEYSY